MTEAHTNMLRQLFCRGHGFPNNFLSDVGKGAKR